MPTGEEEQDVVFLRTDLDRAPRRKNRNCAQKRRQNHQQQADAVDAQRVARSDRGIQSCFRELKTRRVGARLNRQISGSETISPRKAKRLPMTRCAFSLSRARTAATTLPPACEQHHDRYEYCKIPSARSPSSATSLKRDPERVQIVPQENQHAEQHEKRIADTRPVCSIRTG